VTGVDAVRRRRLAAQLLAGRPARSAAAAAARLLAIQAQNLRAGRLAVRARSTGLTAAGVNAELERCDVVISWLCRGTLHLVCREDYPWLLGLAAPTLRTGNLRRLEQCGYSPDRARRAAAAIVRMLEDEGPMPRAEIGRRLEAAGYVLADQALVHLLFLPSLDGRVIRGPFRGAEQAFVLTRDWLGEEPVPLAAGERPGALAELARRYLAGHGPATAADLALWAGLPLRDAVAGLEGASTRLVDAGGGLVDLKPVRRAPRTLPPRLLPAFDAYLLGWKDRTYAVPPEHVAEIRMGGMINPVAVVDGVAVGRWTSRRSGRRIDVDIACWGDVGEPADAALAAEAADVVRFEGGI
jgi:Winged helix DNA-binding domain